MNCPNCGAPEQVRVRVCPSCGEAYVNEDVIELGRLEHLLEVTSSWDVPEELRIPYAQRLEALRVQLGLAGRAPVGREGVLEVPPISPPKPAAPEWAQLAGVGPAPAEAAAVPTAATVAASAEPAAVAPTPGAAKAPPAPPRERVPFDQWLLSERNIKIALYSGGILLVLAGLIFVGVNWARIPGMGKFAITLALTALTYAGGYLLFRRPAYRIGGVALLAIASGFLTLNFAVLQTYVLGPRGLQDELMWLIASLACLVPYFLTAYWTRNQLFTWFSLGALASALTALLTAVGALPLGYFFAYSVLAMAVLLVGWALRRTGLRDLTRVPLLVASQVAMPAAALAAVASWVAESVALEAGSPWLMIGTLAVAVVFYATTEVLYGWLAARWAAAVLVLVTVALIAGELDLGKTATGAALMALALVYLGVGYLLERREQRRAGAWPLYAMAYVIASALTLAAVGATDDLARMLLGDVVILAASAAIHRNYRWVYGAAWLFILPAYLILDLTVPALYVRGLAMGGLGLIYTAAGYGLGRRELRLGGPFLTAAACLTAIAVGLTWGNLVASACTLVIVAALYALIAVWRRWPWLLIPALVALNLLLVPINRIAFEGRVRLAEPLAISYGVLGAALALGALGLRRGSRTRWALPLYLVAALDLAGAYVASLVLGGWLAVGLSVELAALLLALAWYEQSFFSEKKLPPVLAYLGVLVVFVGNLYLMATISARSFWDVPFWPAYSAALCALFVVLAWVVRRGAAKAVYSAPLRYAGLSLMAVPLVGSVGGAVSGAGYVPGVVAFSVAGLTYGADAALRRVRWLGWVAVAVVFVDHFFVMGAVGGSAVWDVWPVYTAGLCALFVVLGWLARGWFADIFATPLTMAGLWLLLAVPGVGSLYIWLAWATPWVAAVSFGIAAAVHVGHGLLRRRPEIVYVGIGSFVVMLWAVLAAFEVSEAQAYAIPPGLALLGIGWNERTRGRTVWYRLLTIAGLLVLMVSAFVQSLPRGAYRYAILLGVESLAALGWGIWKRSRTYVVLGAPALVANAIAQFGPGFVELPRWVQIGVTGVILLGGGLFGLFRRERILATRRRVAQQWREWEP